MEQLTALNVHHGTELSKFHFIWNVFSWLKKRPSPKRKSHFNCPQESFQLSPRGRFFCLCLHRLIYFLQIWGHLQKEHTSSSAVTEGLGNQLWVVYVLHTKEMERGDIFFMRTNKHFFVFFFTLSKNCKPLEDKNHITNAILYHNKSTHYLMISYLQLGVSWSES